jgi:hypothetical protein
MSQGRYSNTTHISVPSTGGALSFVFSDECVTVSIGTEEEIEMSWAEWEHIARVYGKKPVAREEHL